MFSAAQNTITDTLCFFPVCFPYSFLDRILKGNLAPGGAVAKITGKEGLGFTGKARAFDTEDDFVKAVENGSIQKGEKTVVILRYLGPQGGPGEFFLISSLKPLSSLPVNFLSTRQRHLFDLRYLRVFFPIVSIGRRREILAYTLISGSLLFF